jgi:uncharacterized protein (TIGR02246 family)
MRSRLLLAVVVPFIACTTEAGRGPETEGTQTGDATDARAQIERLRNDWIAAAERDDAATVAQMYVDDAAIVDAAAAPAQGREAIQTMLTQNFSSSRNLRVNSHDLTVVGDLAYDYGEFSVQVTPPGQAERTQSGHYVVVLRRQADGNWKIVRHLSTTPSTPPTAGTRAPARTAD